MNLTVIFSALPFIIFLFLITFRKIPLIKVTFITLLTVVLLTFFYWQILPSFLLSSLFKGLYLALDISLIIFGALFFLEILKKLKIIDNLSYLLETFSKDYRVQIIFLAWFFENFIEGTAGFGTPAAIVAPLLIGIGLTPIHAVIIALLGNSTSVVFGAAGTPIRVGFAGLNLAGIPLYSALFNLVGFIVPVFILYVSTQGRTDSKKEFWEALPFAVWSGIAFVVPSLIFVFLGQEFPSILGSIAGILLVAFTSKHKLFLPKRIIDPHLVKKPEVILPLRKTLFPYLFLIILLIFGKFLLGNSGFKTNFVITHTFNFYNPGLAFLIALIPTILLFRLKKPVIEIFKKSLQKTIEPFLVIAFASVMVQILINSNQNLSNFPSILEVLSKGLENQLLPFLAPFVGAFGSFLTGSATVSNIMLGNFLSLASEVQKMAVAKILSLELVGAAAGNMIALADILSAETVVSLRNEERTVIKGVLIPCLIYLFLTGIIGIISFKIILLT